MEANLTALLEQDLNEYEIVFIVDDPEDPAVGPIETIRRDPRRQTKLVIAEKATGSSQKVENLREGVLHADDRSEVFAFVDSDTRPSPGWLRALIAPLRDETVGAATGYRWFISYPRSLAGELRSVWNASIASALGPNEKGNFCWGGSMAIRRDTFEKLEIRERWRGTLSDDFTVTRAMKQAGLRIRFVPRALVASIESCTFRGLLEFTNRQMKITRVYAPHLWRLSFFGSGLYCSIMAASAVMVFLGVSQPIAFWVAVATLALVTMFSVAKAWLRFRAVSLVLEPQFPLFGRQLLPQLALWLPVPALFLLNSIAASFSRRVRWRGAEYSMVSASETRILK